MKTPPEIDPFEIPDRVPYIKNYQYVPTSTSVDSNFHWHGYRIQPDPPPKKYYVSLEAYSDSGGVHIDDIDLELPYLWHYVLDCPFSLETFGVESNEDPDSDDTPLIYIILDYHDGWKDRELKLELIWGSGYYPQTVHINVYDPNS